MKDRLEPLPAQRPRDRLAGDLLPPRAGLLVTHDEVLVVDAGQVKVQLATIYFSFPHQTGVTERSIGRNYGDPAHRVMQNVMIGHLPERVSGGLAIEINSQHEVITCDEIRVAYSGE